MILLNFGQKLQKIQFDQFNALTSLSITEQIMIPVESSTEEDFHKRLDSMFEKVKLTDEELQKEQFAIVPPPHSITAIKVISDLFKRTGQFPIVIRTISSTFGMTLGPMLGEVLDLEKLFK